MKKIEIFSALLGDVALPLIGFLFWDWGFYFISLFFLFDLLFRTLFIKRRLKPIDELKNRRAIIFKAFLFTFLEVILIHCIVVGAFPHTNIGDSFIYFLTYEEMGIAQGVVLLPLLLLNEVMKIRNENKMGIPYSVRAQVLSNNQDLQRYRILMWVLIYLLVLFFPVPEIFLIMAFFIFLTAQPFLVFRNIK
ncbi:hypothetical protein OAM07_04250 [Crocinitomicaceae bacterium]|nr:hypothetical protein [Flavobacteriales bacterium]MDC0272068.1 hypothetical protein [Crocinitomicaceae bacterium]MDC0459946.1 hypothetical protein [Crocinitomicaceae bacterium]